MSQRPLRFVHASDWHLERMPYGLAEVPDHLRELFLEAPCRAAERVVDAVLAHEADFLVLAGDVVRPSRTGPRAPVFLAEQLARLHERSIPVYWAAPPHDADDAWPGAVRLPENVHLFAHDFAEQFTFQRGDQEIVRLIGMGGRQRGRIPVGEFRPDSTGLFTIAVAHGSSDAASLKSRGVHYWALGGRHARTTLFAAEHVAHYPGTPQGRHPREPGPHGCTLVHVEPDMSPRLTFIPTDVLRWHAERVVLDAQTTRARLEAMLLERRNALSQSAAGAELLVEWSVSGSGPLISELRRGTLGGELLNVLRSEADGPAKSVWSSALAAEPASMLEPHPYQQETILGEFLRIVSDCHTDESRRLDLVSYLRDDLEDEELAHWAILNDRDARQRVLRDAAALGLDLLGGEEVVR